MKIKITILSALMVLSLVQCNKDEDSKDLTQDIVGSYSNTIDDAQIVVNKIDNSTVSITVDSDYWDFAFANVKMNSATAFTLNSYTRQGDVCDGEEAISGTGTASNNNISLFIAIEGIGNGSPHDCQDATFDVSASK